MLFPGKTADAEAVRVEFGDVPAGGTTGYRDVPSGVYPYAAYQYRLGDRVVTQPITDWIGESPPEGNKFTYRLALDWKKQMGNRRYL